MEEFVGHFTVFVLACFVGWYVVWKVTPALHTPLMSATNAISGIILVGGIVAAGVSPVLASEGSLGAAFANGEPRQVAGLVVALIAILVASINVVGGFWVTQRMLGMFHKKGGA